MLLAFGPAVAVIVFLVYWVVRDWKTVPRFHRRTRGPSCWYSPSQALRWCFWPADCAAVWGVAWRFGVANLSRRRGESVVQIVAFGTGIMVLLLLGIVRDDLNSDWKRTLPANIPNYFFINIPPGDRDAFVRFLTEHGAQTARMLPMIRGRLDEYQRPPGRGNEVSRRGG